MDSFFLVYVNYSVQYGSVSTYRHGLDRPRVYEFDFLNLMCYKMFLMDLNTKIYEVERDNITNTFV